MAMYLYERAIGSIKHRSSKISEHVVEKIFEMRKLGFKNVSVLQPSDNNRPENKECMDGVTRRSNEWRLLLIDPVDMMHFESDVTAFVI